MSKTRYTGVCVELHVVQAKVASEVMQRFVFLANMIKGGDAHFTFTGVTRWYLLGL